MFKPCIYTSEQADDIYNHWEYFAEQCMLKAIRIQIKQCKKATNTAGCVHNAITD